MGTGFKSSGSPVRLPEFHSASATHCCVTFRRLIDPSLSATVPSPAQEADTSTCLPRLLMENTCAPTALLVREFSTSQQSPCTCPWLHSSQGILLKPVSHWVTPQLPTRSGLLASSPPSHPAPLAPGAQAPACPRPQPCPPPALGSLALPRGSPPHSGVSPNVGTYWVLTSSFEENISYLLIPA